MKSTDRRVEPANDQRHEYVLDLKTGAWLRVEDFLGNSEYGDVVALKRVALRMDIANGKVRYVCPWCNETMILSSVPTKDRSADRFFFKHLHDTGECSGTKGKSAKAICAQRFAQSKEGPLHKLFKARLLDSLEADPEFTDTDAEKRWKDVDGMRWRQPDVQSTHRGQRVAFEVQLSTTFLHVITDRMAFYERNQARLLWLFSKLDSSQFRMAEDDIFYTNNRNAFRISKQTVKLSREHQQFTLECMWHEPVVVDGVVVDQVSEEIVLFRDLIFDVSMAGAPRAYYFNYEVEKAALLKQVAAENKLLQDEPLRRDFENFYIAYLRKEIAYPERQQQWSALVARFHQRGFHLPEYPDHDDGPHFYLIAAYSAKLGAPTGMRHDNLVKLGHYLIDHRKQAIWIFRLMLLQYHRHQHVIAHDPTGKWAEKAKHYKKALIQGDGDFLPNRLFDPILSFLFSEISDKLIQHPRDVIKK